MEFVRALVLCVCFSVQSVFRTAKLHPLLPKPTQAG